MTSRTVAIAGAFNALTAIQIERAGFDAVYVSGAAVAAARGLPDIGLLALTEVVAEAGIIARATGTPTLADADTGFGPPLVVRRAVREFERAGLAGIQIEDQEMPKKCGHLPGKRVVSLEEMVAKIKAAVQGRHDPAFMIVARTDARSVEGLSSAIDRARAYVAAGADAIFPEALESAEEFRTVAERLRKEDVRVPLIANMTEWGKTPYLTLEEFQRLGYHGVLFPVTTLRAAAKAVEEVLAALKRAGSQRAWLDHLQTRQQLYDLLHYREYEEWERRLYEDTGDAGAEH